ncbi:hypothetical protein GCM10009566_39370 [Streptomyces murinus]
MAVALHRLTHPPLVQYAHATGVKSPGPLPPLHVCAAVLFEDDTPDPPPQKESGQREPSDSAPYDHDSRVLAGLGHGFELLGRKRCRTRPGVNGPAVRVARRTDTTVEPGSPVTNRSMDTRYRKPANLVGAQFGPSRECVRYGAAVARLLRRSA